MTIKAGDTFLLDCGLSYPRHLHIALTDSEGDPPCALLVPINSLKDCSDSTVILRAADRAHPFIVEDSAVSYEIMESMYVDEVFDRDMNTGPQIQIAQKYLPIIQQGALLSERTVNGMRKAIKRRLSL